jgi:hypothetical protein
MPGESERIGEVLISEGVITQEDIVKAIADSGIKGSPLASILEASAHVKRADLAAFLASDFRVPVVEDLRRIDFSDGAAKLVPEDLARKHELVPVCKVGSIVCVAKANYFNRAALNELNKVVHDRIKVLQADESQVRAAIERVYKGKRGDLPPPALVKKETAKVAPVTAGVSAGLEEIAAFEAIPLISPGLEDAPAERTPRKGGTSVRLAPSPAPVPAARHGTYDEVIEIMDALRMPPHEYASALRDPFMKMFADFDDVFHLGKPAPPVRVS